MERGREEETKTTNSKSSVLSFSVPHFLSYSSKSINVWQRFTDCVLFPYSEQHNSLGGLRFRTSFIISLTFGL